MGGLGGGGGGGASDGIKIPIMKILLKCPVENTRYFSAVLALQPELAPFSSSCVTPKNTSSG